MKKIGIIITSLIFIVSVISCGFSIKTVLVPENKYRENYDKMFEAAIDAGAGLGYHPEYQDKEKGMLKLYKKVMSNEYRISVQFGKSKQHGGKLGFMVHGQTSEDIVNPVIGMDVDKVIEAINTAANQ